MKTLIASNTITLKLPFLIFNLFAIVFFAFPIFASAQSLKGWEHLYYLMQEHGADPTEARKVLSDPRMPKWEYVFFNANPKEPRNIYSKQNTKINRANAMKFFRQHKKTFDQAELRYGVRSSVILSIIQMESGCGRFTGNKRVFYRLARLAGVAELKNVKKNIEANKGSNISPGKIMERAHWLEKTFLPHLVATIELAKKMGIHPHEIRGSYSGAIGLPQFLPGNVLEFGVDGDRDGKINIFDPDDAIPSTANYLSHLGWKPGIIIREQRKVIRGYNNSDPYIDTVLGMANALRNEM